MIQFPSSVPIFFGKCVSGQQKLEGVCVGLKDKEENPPKKKTDPPLSLATLPMLPNHHVIPSINEGLEMDRESGQCQVTWRLHFFAGFGGTNILQLFH